MKIILSETPPKENPGLIGCIQSIPDYTVGEIWNGPDGECASSPILKKKTGFAMFGLRLYRTVEVGTIHWYDDFRDNVRITIKNEYFDELKPAFEAYERNHDDELEIWPQ
jgi:hypothetical protein